MDNASPYRPPSAMHFSERDDCDPFSTPTPASRYLSRSSDHSPFKTPKPLSARALSSAKGKGRQDGRVFGDGEDEDVKETEELCEATLPFTLGYLRRVPSLAEMARAVVRAERKRRDKMARKLANEGELGESQSKASSLDEKSRRGRKCDEPHGEPTGKKTKRLFKKAIRELFEDGSVVLTEGRHVRPWTDAYREDTSFMWKVSSSASTATQSSTCSSASGTILGSVEEEELSEPDSNEEGYLPATPAVMSSFVEEAIRKLSARIGEGASTSRSFRRSKAAHSPPTVEDITEHLRRDARLAYVSQLTVEDTLEGLKKEERVYRAGGGRWALCL